MHVTNFIDQSKSVVIGDLRNLSPNAEVIVKIAVFTAWAELQISSSSLPHLVGLVKPYLSLLAPSWLDLLRDYAKLRFEPDITASSTGLALDDLDQIYSSLNRSTLLQVCFNNYAMLKLKLSVLSKRLASVGRCNYKFNRGRQRFHVPGA